MCRSQTALWSCFLVFFNSAFAGGPVKYFHVSGIATALAELVVLLPSSAGVHDFVVDVELFSVLQGFQFYVKEAY